MRRSFALDWAAGSLRGSLAGDEPSFTYDRDDGRVRSVPAGVVLGEDPFRVLGDRLACDPAATWVGWFGYTARADLPGRTMPVVPDAVWMRTQATWQAGRARNLSPRHRLPETPHVGPVPESYRRAFAEVQEQLHAGNSYEVNLTRRVRVGSDADPVWAYRRLRAINPAPYAAHLHHDGVDLVAASPECFVRVVPAATGRRIVSRPIKGTTPRGGSPGQDAAHRRRLAEDPRFRAENLMVTDLVRSDLARVCRPGTVEVTALMEVEAHPSVHQLVTTVEGVLRDDVSTTDALRALFPAGSMTGAPKQRTMEIIDAVEESPRGLYAGAYGWVRGDGAAELAVVIRSLVHTAAGWTVGTGGGITVHSDVTSEWAESQWKVQRLREVLDENGTVLPGAG